MVFFIGWAACTIERRLVAAAGYSLVQAATDAASKLELLVSEKQRTVAMLASAPAVREENAAFVSRSLRHLRETYVSFRWVVVTDHEGRAVAATDPAMEGRRFDHESWFVRAGKHPGAAVLEHGSDSTDTITVSTRLSRPGAGRDRVVAAAIDVQALLDMVDETMRVLQGVEWFDDAHIEYQLLNRDGDLIADSTGLPGPLNLRAAGLPSASLVALEPRGFVEERHVRRGAQVITGYAQVTIPGGSSTPRWGILIRVDRGSVLAPVQAFLRQLMWVTVLLIVPLSLLLLWLVRTLHREWRLATGESQRAAAAEAVLAKRTEALHSLVAAATMLSRDRHLDELLEHLLDLTRLTTRAQYAALWIPGRELRGVSSKLITGPEALTAAIAELRHRHGTGQWLAPEQGTLRLTGSKGSLPDGRQQPLLTSLLGIPIRCHGQRFGELILANKRVEAGRDDEFNDLDEQVAQTLVTQAGIAIENLLLLEESRQRARLDGMTGLLNHSAAMDALARELARAQREQTALAVIMADLDHFKQVNDTYGHGVGDLVIRETAARLQEATRLYDLIGRMGGEEFLVLVPACDLLGAADLAERVRLAMSEHPIKTPAGALTVTVSLGATVWSPGMVADGAHLLERADQALYRAKARGRNTSEVLPASLSSARVA